MQLIQVLITANKTSLNSVGYIRELKGPYMPPGLSFSHPWARPTNPTLPVSSNLSSLTNDKHYTKPKL